MANITRVSTTTVPYTTGVANATIDAINQAITQADIAIAEINLSGGDGMGDRVPSAAQLTFIPDNINVADNFSDVAVGVIAWGTGSDTTNIETLGFTADGVILSSSVTVGENVLATISGTAVTFTRTTTTDSQITSYLAFQKD